MWFNCMAIDIWYPAVDRDINKLKPITINSYRNNTLCYRLLESIIMLPKNICGFSRKSKNKFITSDFGFGNNDGADGGCVFDIFVIYRFHLRSKIFIKLKIDCRLKLVTLLYPVVFHAECELFVCVHVWVCAHERKNDAKQPQFGMADWA